MSASDVAQAPARRRSPRRRRRASRSRRRSRRRGPARRRRGRPRRGRRAARDRRLAASDPVVSRAQAASRPATAVERVAQPRRAGRWTAAETSYAGLGRADERHVRRGAPAIAVARRWMLEPASSSPSAMAAIDRVEVAADPAQRARRAPACRARRRRSARPRESASMASSAGVTTASPRDGQLRPVAAGRRRVHGRDEAGRAERDHDDGDAARRGRRAGRGTACVVQASSRWSWSRRPLAQVAELRPPCPAASNPKRARDERPAARCCRAGAGAAGRWRPGTGGGRLRRRRPRAG